MDKRLSFSTKAAAVTDALRTEILGGALPPGTPLLQEEVAGRLGISSTPVREAFTILESEGLVHRRPHRGVVVALAQEVPPSEAEAIYRIRHLLEKQALRRVAAGDDRAVLQRLKQVIRDGDRARKERDYVRYRQSISEFHRTLALATGSELFTGLLVALSSRSQFFASGLSRVGLREAHDHHRSIVTAAEKGDIRRALRTESHHLAANLALLKRGAPPAVRSRSRVG